MRTATLVLLMCIGLTACRATEPVTEPMESQSPFLISNPVANPTVRAVQPSAGSSSAAGLVYVSLPAGTIPDGLDATILNQRTGDSVVVGMINGGLDPTPIPGAAGDTLDIIISLSGSGQQRFVATVPVRARPKVVRADPSPHKRDVPLNASMIVVFSEPIAAGTLTISSLQLKRGDVPVDGEIRFLDDRHASVAFTPRASLAPLSEHQLLVSSAIRDLDGDPLEEDIAVGFTTAAEPDVGELRVNVSSTGDAPDPDGYVLAIAGQLNRSTGVNDTLSFVLPVGTYTTYLSGLAPNCFSLGWDTLRPTIESGKATVVTFKVACPMVTADALLVVVRSVFAGSGWPPAMTFALRVDGDPDQAIAPNGYVIISPMAPGAHTVAIKTPQFFGSFCAGMAGPNGLLQRTVTVPPDTFGRVEFDIICIP